MKKTITIFFVLITLQISAQCWTNISAGANHSLAIKNDGTLWAWGKNYFGQLGDNTNIDKIIPTQIGTENNWIKIFASYERSFAIKSNGTLWAWGWNNLSQLGNGNNVNQSLPIQIGTDTNWVDISGGLNHGIGLKSDGTIWTWGANSNGELGDGTNVNKNNPVKVGTANNWESITSGDNHCLAIKTDGTLWAWGFNTFGQLGNGATSNINQPVQIGTANNWLKVKAGSNHTIAIKTDGTLWAWGSNSNGELGNGTYGSSFNSTSPIQIGTSTDWNDISAGYHFTYGIKNNSTIWSWGKNDYGQLANGTNGATNTLIPTQIGTSTDTSKISAGIRSYTLLLNNSGIIKASGENYYGQLGDATTVDKNVFTPISCYPSVLSIEDFEIGELKVYPNPVNNVLNILWDNEIAKVSIYNLLGQEISAQSVESNQASIDITNLFAGTYLVTVESGSQVKTIKVVKN